MAQGTLHQPSIDGRRPNSLPGVTQSADEEDFLASVQTHIRDAARRLALDEGIQEVLQSCERELSVSVPILMDDGSLQLFCGYRVQHCSARGPCKGGIRYHPSATLQETMSKSGTPY